VDCWSCEPAAGDKFKLIGGRKVYKLLGLSLLLVGAASSAFALDVVAPEIDGASAISALVLLSGGLLVLRARRKK
jgi:hypothetical protein